MLTTPYAKFRIVVSWKTMGAARLAIFTWIETWYNLHTDAAAWDSVQLKSLKRA
jgi:hypothetical protein